MGLSLFCRKISGAENVLPKVAEQWPSAANHHSSTNRSLKDKLRPLKRPNLHDNFSYWPEDNAIRTLLVDSDDLNLKNVTHPLSSCPQSKQQKCTQTHAKVGFHKQSMHKDTLFTINSQFPWTLAKPEQRGWALVKQLRHRKWHNKWHGLSALQLRHCARCTYNLRSRTKQISAF